MRNATTLRRQNRSSRNFPSSTASASSTFEAATIRTSTRTGRSPPTRTSSRSSRTRRRPTWALAGRSATSSRKRVPPSASSRRPRRRSRAPVNAPFSWPKNSLSTRVAGMAPQLTATKGPSLLFEWRWIARATSSLPVPDSPWTRTVVSRGATLEMRWKMSAIAPEVPTMFSGRKRSSSCPSSRSTRASRRASSRARSATSRSSALSNGLVT